MNSYTISLPSNVHGTNALHFAYEEDMLELLENIQHDPSYHEYPDGEYRISHLPETGSAQPYGTFTKSEGLKRT